MNNKLKNLQNLKSKGYAIIGDSYIYSIKRKLRQELLSLSNFILHRNNSKKKFKNLEDAVRFMFHLDKTTNKKTLSELYELAPTFPFFHNLASEKKFLNIIKKAGLKIPTVGTNPAIRVDRPFDKKFNTLIHQDFWYSFISKNSITIWFTINNIELNKIGNLKINEEFKNKKILKFKQGNQQTFSANKNFTKSTSFKEVKLKKDEILIFNQLLPHLSGKNISSYPRISIQLRYNDLKNSRFLKSSFKCVSTDHVKNMQKKYYIK